MTVEERLQVIINSLDTGLGLRILRLFLCVAVTLFVFAAFYHAQFRGMRDPAAMETAQLARNIAEGRGFTTDCVRPFDLAYLRQHGKEVKPGTPLADIRTAPLHPLVLSLAFRATRPDFSTGEGGGTYVPERRVIVPLGILLSVGAGWLIFLAGRRLFGTPAALLAAVLYFLSERVLAGAISGTAAPLRDFLVAAAGCLGLALVRPMGEPLRPFARVAAFVGAGVLSGLAFLTDYTAGIFAVALALYVGFSFSRARWSLVAAFLGLAALVALPWLIRNQAVCGSVLGAAPYKAFEATWLYPADSLWRDPAANLNHHIALGLLRDKLARNLPSALSGGIPGMGAGLAICFFLASFFHRFEDDEINRLRWCVALGLLLLIPIGALGGNAAAILSVFLPLALLYAAAFFFVVVEGAGIFEESWRHAVTGIFILLAGLPAGLRIAGGRADLPYPPYYPPLIEYVCALVEPGETVCTDIPWATAWYGRRPSLLLPRTIDQFVEMSAASARGIPALYLTQQTSDKPYASALRGGSESTWLPLIDGRVPEGFPLRHGLKIPPRRQDQVFLTDRVRWTEPEPVDLAEDGEDGVDVRPQGL